MGRTRTPPPLLVTVLGVVLCLRLPFVDVPAALEEPGWSAWSVFLLALLVVVAVALVVGPLTRARARWAA